MAPRLEAGRGEAAEEQQLLINIGHHGYQVLGIDSSLHMSSFFVKSATQSQANEVNAGMNRPQAPRFPQPPSSPSSVVPQPI